MINSIIQMDTAESSKPEFESSKPEFESSKTDDDTTTDTDAVTTDSVTVNTAAPVTTELYNRPGMEYLADIEDKSIDLILTDPPYIISRESGMNTHYDTVKKNEKLGIDSVKGEDEWLAYKLKHDLKDDKKKDKYMKFGTIYGKKYCTLCRLRWADSTMGT